MKYLGYSIADAKYLSADMLSLKPYQRDGGDPINMSNLYGIIDSRHTLGFFSSCIVVPSQELRGEIASLDFPGGVHVNFHHQKKGDWLIVFKAQNIIASRYARMTHEDFMSVLRDSGIDISKIQEVE